MNRLLLFLFILIVQSACTPVTQVVVVPEKQKVIDAVGYSALSNFKNHPQAQQRLLAIRAAKLDAYRNLAEEVYGVRIRSNSTVKNMLIESDSYRAYVDAVVRGAHLVSITPKEGGVYEAEVSLILTPKMSSCLYRHSADCSVMSLSNTSVNHTMSHNQNYNYPMTGSSYGSGISTTYYAY